MPSSVPTFRQATELYVICISKILNGNLLTVLNKVSILKFCRDQTASRFTISQGENAGVSHSPCLCLGYPFNSIRIATMYDITLYHFVFGFSKAGRAGRIFNIHESLMARIPNCLYLIDILLSHWLSMHRRTPQDFPFTFLRIASTAAL